MKIIDFEKKGNVVRFYLGADDCEDYNGDDWNDAPYECNAGRVYDEFIVAHADVAFPFEWAVCEPCDGPPDSFWRKYDMKHKKVPCVVAMPEPGWLDTSFNDIAVSQEAIRIYFGDSLSELEALALLDCNVMVERGKDKGARDEQR